MKLWALVDIRRLPRIFGGGLDNPLSEEIIFHSEPEGIAERALEFEGALAFIEVDFPDAEIDEWFGFCMESHFLDLDEGKETFEEHLEQGELSEEEYAAQSEWIAGMEAAVTEGTGSALLTGFGYACLFVDMVVPPEMITLLDPNTMLEAVYTGDVEVIEEAMETAEGQSFKTLGANFWVFLIMFMAGLFGPNWNEAAEAEEAERKAKARQRRRKPARRRKKRVPRKRKRKRKPRKVMS